MDLLTVFVNEWLSSIVAGIVGVSATWVISFFYFRKAILALLHDRIYQACNFYIKRDWVTINDLKNLNHLYQPYKKLGGNDVCHELYERVLKLDLRTGDPEPAKGDM